MRNYDRKEATGAKILSQVDKGRLSKEVYIMHESISGSEKVHYTRLLFRSIVAMI